MIVDNNAENFQVHPENGIFIKSWYGDMNDQALVRLAPILRGRKTVELEISMTNADDIRVVLKRVKEAMTKSSKKTSSGIRD
jgi:CTD small phosphatase-like protein 2